MTKPSPNLPNLTKDNSIGWGFTIEDDSKKYYSEELKKYKCPHCDESFTFRVMFNDHRKTVHHWGRFLCAEAPKCNAEFALLKDLIRDGLISQVCLG